MSKSQIPNELSLSKSPSKIGDEQMQRSGFHSEFSSLISRWVALIAMSARKKMYKMFVDNFGEPQSVLDVGVTSENVAAEANFFEEWFPYKNRITAVGIEDASHLEKRYPGLKFVKVVSGKPLPFADQSFEVVFSNAVIEHVTDEPGRKFFFEELCRVGRKVYLTTPYLYFPVEHHTGTPFIHFLFPRLFYFLLDKKVLSKFYSSTNLKILPPAELIHLGKSTRRNFKIEIVKVGPFKSNMVLMIESPAH